MTRIRRSFLRKSNSLIAWVLSVCGIACTNIACEYGTPEAKFTVYGTVKSEETNLPVEHFQVIMRNDTAFSDAVGKYKVSVFDFPTSQSFDLNLKDVDGSDHGEFAPKDTLIQFENPNFKSGDGHWYKGETDKEVNIRLKTED